MTERKTNAAGIALIKRFEGLRLRAYVCPAGKLTIGWGHTGDVKATDVITEHEAEAILETDLDKFERAVCDLVKVPLSDNHFAALVSFSFNLGINALAKSSLLRLLNKGDFKGASIWFPKWNHIGTVVNEGLTKRRFAEKALFDAVVVQA